MATLRTGRSVGLLPILALVMSAALHESAGLKASPALHRLADRPAAGTYSLLYSFCSGGSRDGENPYAGLIRDSSGNLYGTTDFGGQYGYGAVFKVTSAGTETVLHSFAGSPSDGANPFYGSLTLDAAGNVYGSTEYGGEFGWGTVFQVTATGTENVLYNFTGGSDGLYPEGGLVRDSAGILYGTAEGGGTYGYGVVFKLAAPNTESVLYSFGSSSIDGANPTSNLTRDSSGNLYGTTEYGTSSLAGTVFKVTASGAESLIYNFQGGGGVEPVGGGLLRDTSGNLYGATTRGGAAGHGVIFRLSPEGTETVLLNFSGGTGGAEPIDGLSKDAAGNLYGTTIHGGSGTGCAFEGCGVLFELTTTGKEIVLHNFSLASSSDGAYPEGGVIRDPSGNLYGTLEYSAYGCGAVFKYTP